MIGFGPLPGVPNDQCVVSDRSFPAWPKWVQTYGSSAESENLYDIVACSGGGYALIGYTYSNTAGSADAWLVRTDSSGNYLWNATIGGSSSDFGKAIVEVSDGFVFAGYTRSYGEYTSNYNGWLVKTDLNGNHLWNYSFGGSGTDEFHGLVAASGGGYTMVGRSYSYAVGSADGWLLHTDASGSHQWNYTYGDTGYDRCYDVVECAGGGYALCGQTVSFGLSSYAGWLIRTDADGIFQWNETYDGTSGDYLYALVECSAGGYALAGETWSYGVSSGAAWLVRTNAAGLHLWNQTYDDDQAQRAYDIIETNYGFTLAGDDGNIPVRINGDSDAMLIHTDFNGQELLWTTYGGYDNEAYQAVIQTSDAGYVTTGGSYTFGPGGWDGWLVKTHYTLVWHIDPQDQTIAYGDPFAYDLTTAPWVPIDTWTISDTTNFAINQYGLITNAVVLPVGTYPLQVTVNDTIGTTLTGTFTVTVVATFAPMLLPIFIGVIAIVIIICILLLAICLYQKRKT